MIRRAVALLLATAGSAPLAAQGLAYEGGISVASGNYIFADRTTSWMLSTGLGVTAGRVTLRATLPVYLQNTTLVAITGAGMGGIPTGGSSSGAVADSGAAREHRGNGMGPGGGGMGPRQVRPSFASAPVEVPGSAVTGYQAAVGDPTLQLAWKALDGPGTSLAASVQVKAPVADTATYGTGQWDVGTGVAVTQRVGQRGLVGLDVSYWHLGDLPTLDFSDPIYGTVGFSYAVSSPWIAGLSFSAGTALLEGYDPPVSVGGFLGRASPAGAWSVSAGLGLTETTPDFSVGATWRVRLLAGL